MWNRFVNLEISTNGHVISVICIHLPFKIRGMSTAVGFRVAHIPLYRLLCNWQLELQRNWQFFFSLTALSIWCPKIFVGFGFNIKSNSKAIKIFICPLLNVCNGARDLTCYNYWKSVYKLSVDYQGTDFEPPKKQCYSLWIQPK